MQKIGDRPTDSKAKDILTKAFSQKTIEQIAISWCCRSIHCATQQEPKFQERK